MICEKCGQSNIQGLSKCAYCKADMPAASGGGGFADILSYTAPESAVSDTPYYERERKTEGISDADMQKLIKKSDNIMRTTQKNTFFGLIAIVLSLVILLSSVIIGVKTIGAVNDCKEDIAAYKAQVEQMNKKIGELSENLKVPAGGEDTKGELSSVDEGEKCAVIDVCEQTNKKATEIYKIIKVKENN